MLKVYWNKKRLEFVGCSYWNTSVFKNGGRARHKSATHAWENTIKREELRAVDRCVSLLLLSSQSYKPSDSKRRLQYTHHPAAQKRSCKPTQIGFYALCTCLSKTTKNEDKKREDRNVELTYLFVDFFLARTTIWKSLNFYVRCFSMVWIWQWPSSILKSLRLTGNKGWLES